MRRNLWELSFRGNRSIQRVSHADLRDAWRFEDFSSFGSRQSAPREESALSKVTKTASAEWATASNQASAHTLGDAVLPVAFSRNRLSTSGGSATNITRSSSYIRS